MVVTILAAGAGGSYVVFGRKPRQPAGAVNGWHETTHSEGDGYEVEHHAVHDPVLQHHDIDAVHLNHHIPIDHLTQHEEEIHHAVHTDQDEHHAEVHDEHHGKQEEEWHELDVHADDDGRHVAEHQGELGLYDMGFKGKIYFGLNRLLILKDISL